MHKALIILHRIDKTGVKLFICHTVLVVSIGSHLYIKTNTFPIFLYRNYLSLFTKSDSVYIIHVSVLILRVRLSNIVLVRT